MIKRTVLLITLAAAVGATLPRTADADYDCALGPITAVTANSITIQERETTRTFGIDCCTRYTTWPTRGRWQAITLLNMRELFTTSRLLDIGRFVAIHPRHDGTNVARWVQISLDKAYDSGYWVVN